MLCSARLYPVLAFLFLGSVWGTHFFYMKIAVELITPMQVVFLRVLFALPPLLLYAFFSKKISFSHMRYSHHFFVMGLAAVLNYLGFARGAEILPSGIAGALSGIIPLFTFMATLLIVPEEKVSFFKVVGVVLGFVGGIMLGSPSGADLAAMNWDGLFFMGGGALSVGVSFAYARRFITPLKLPAIALATYQVVFSFFILMCCTDFSDIMNLTQGVHATLGVVVSLGILGTGLAYVLYYYIVDTMGALAGSSVTYVPPLVALCIGGFIGENIRMLDIVATILIFAGVFLLQKKSPKSTTLA